ncbi:MAG: class F sortase [Thermoleophilaceae bacterium]
MGALTAVGVIILLSAARTAAPPSPPLGRPLPATAFAGEGRAHRRLVQVVDRQAAPPLRIRVPAIGVSARVVPLRRAADGTMQTPARFGDAGWFEPGPEPGERGGAVIAGHVDSKVGPAVFFDLGRLHRGNLIRILRADGSVVRFRVEGLERWPKARFPTRRVFGRTRGSTLRLITCSGSFDSSSGHYLDNTVVYASRVPTTRTEQARPLRAHWRRTPTLVPLGTVK